MKTVKRVSNSKILIQVFIMSIEIEIQDVKWKTHHLKYIRVLMIIIKEILIMKNLHIINQHRLILLIVRSVSLILYQEIVSMGLSNSGKGNNRRINWGQLGAKEVYLNMDKEEILIVKDLDKNYITNQFRPNILLLRHKLSSNSFC